MDKFDVDAARWFEYCLASRVFQGQLLFVFHTEGLVNNSIYDRLLEFGKRLDGVLSILTLITPLNPTYVFDPLHIDRFRNRREFFSPPATRSMLNDFAQKISMLSENFVIGYHGHFYRQVGSDRYLRTMSDSDVKRQVESELDYLSDLGFKPKVYAGGWWLTSEFLSDLLTEHGFVLDTTFNDKGIDSFGNPQPDFTNPSLARIKSILSPLRTIRLNMGAYWMHDYNLMFPTTFFNFGGRVLNRSKLLPRRAIKDIESALNRKELR